MSMMIAPNRFAAAVTGHRYWRVYITANSGNGSFTGLYEVEMRESAGGADATGSGTAISGGSGSDSPAASKAFDNSLTSGNYWLRSATGTCWIGYDFGVGVTKNIVEVRLDANNYDWAPASGSVDYSDDNVSWTTSFSFTLPGWIASGTRILPEAAPAAGYARFWRIFCDTNNGDASFTQIGEIEFRATSGGADQTSLLSSDTTSTLGRTVYSVTGGGAEAWRAFDNTTGTWVATGTTNQYVGYIFTAPVLVAEVVITCPTPARAPNNFKIQYSHDGSTWTSAKTLTGQTWVANVAKTYSVP